MWQTIRALLPEEFAKDPAKQTATKLGNLPPWPRRRYERARLSVAGPQGRSNVPKTGW